MQTPDGKHGLVPVNYIDKLELPEGLVNSVSPSTVSPSNGGGVDSNAHVNSLPNSSSTHSKSSLPEVPPGKPLDEVSTLHCASLMILHAVWILIGRPCWSSPIITLAGDQL